MRHTNAPSFRYAAKVVLTLAFVFSLLSLPFPADKQISITPVVEANSTYASLSSGNFSFSLTAGTANLITSNDNWTGVNSVEGYFGQNLTATHGVDPQTVLGTEFSGNTLPNTPTQIAANKGNPNAFNAGGLAEFDSGTYIAFGFQGNVQANPYMVFYINSLGRSNVTFSYDVIDIDGGSNNAVSPIALQYRVGTSGSFINLPSGYVADATQGPNIAGLTTSKSVVLPMAAWNQPQVQVRLITTNAANSSGSSTPDEWIGVNNISITSLAPSAAQASISGRVFGSDRRGLSGAAVTMFDELGTPRTATTNTFGYYRLTGLTVGNTYVLTVRSRRYVFDAQLVNLSDDVAGLDFYPLGSGQSVMPSTGVLKRKAPIE